MTKIIIKYENRHFINKKKEKIEKELVELLQELKNLNSKKVKNNISVY
ncbi:hypothetical protein NE172_13635 [Clostridium botulinum]|nr:hypothetical protein [Clostridium botulinum]EES49670.1 hypothetical protein CLO_3653 [Clostridium botulinum E1 str. 'BoNT E Beluga']MBY6762311.1 hypothetical protein [Clostridium botulinum]MBY6921154.1 hypothetical protein [Clostridium botulinum]MCR1131989.1 hypothetical protein [Clostridium botulinum]HBZ6637516.1 hypothetical protein [Clostridium botulinum]